MNQASAFRLSLARQVAEVYARNPHVAAVVAGGSVARGHADRYSDVEIGVFWHEPPAGSERSNVIESAGGDLIRLHPHDAREQVWADDFMMGRAAPGQPRSGVLIEAVHYTAAYIEQVLDDVLERYDTDELKHNLLAAVHDGLPLHGAELLEAWRARTATYPDQLAVAVVRKHAQIDHFWRWEMWLHRGDNLMMLYFSFSQIQQKLFHVLLALNRVYYFGFKWLDVVVSRLTIAPHDLGRRLRQVYVVAPADGARLLAELVEETYDLVEQTLPAVDVPWLRQVFRYRRPLWEDALFEQA